jgi:hypothetical protein
MAIDKYSFLSSLEDKNLFWSYSRGSLLNFSDQVIIETVLLYGSTEDIIQLFKFFGNHDIRKVWQEKIIVDSRYYRLNTYLAKVFFNISDPVKYFKKFSNNSRYERIKKFASSN